MAQNQLRNKVDYCIDKLLIWIIVSSIILFILYPILKLIMVSFMKDGRFTFAQYQDLFNKETFVLIKNSTFIATVSSLGAIIISLVIALYVVFGGNKYSRWLYNILFFTIISPPFVGALAFIMLFGRRGLITYRLLGLRINPYGWQGIVTMQIIGEISFTTIFLVLILKSIDIKILKASKDLGASFIETLKRIILPLALPGIIAVYFIVFTKNIADFGTPIIIGGNYNVLATEAYLTAIGRADLEKAAAMSVLLIIPAFIAFYLYRITMKSQSISGYDYNVLFNRNNENFKISNIFGKIIGLISWVVIFLILLQYVVILLTALSNPSSNKVIFTIEYVKLFNEIQLASLFRSIVYSLIAGIVASFIGLMLSYYAERRKIKVMKSMEFISSLPYIIPGTFFGIAYILAFNKGLLDMTGTVAIVVLNCIFRQISVSNKAANSIFISLDKNIEKVGKDLGASEINIIKDIILPILKPAFINSFINTFTSTMTTIGAIIFLISPGANVITVDMFSAIKNGDYGLGSVIAIVIIIITFIVNFIAIKINEKIENR